MPTITASQHVAEGDRLDYGAQWDGHAGCGPQERAGYAVIQTILEDGRVICLAGDEGAIVRLVIDGAGRYGDTFDLRDEIRRTGEAYAVVGSVYECGHVLW